MEHFKIKISGKEFDASEYQDIIFDNIIHGVGSIIISAAAGAAKTTTIVNAIDLIKGKSLFIAFNTDIVNAIKRKINNSSSRIMTFHSLGLKILKENNIVTDNTVINEFKYEQYIKNNIKDITTINLKDISRNYRQYINNIIKLIEYSRYYLKFKEKDIRKIAEKYGLVLYGDEDIVVKKALVWGENNINIIDYTDMVWLPNVLNLTTKINKYDWIFIDEAQDTTISQQKLIEKCEMRGCRYVIVGDENQQINVWCGADSDAIKNIAKNKNAKQLYLPISYRCPQKIVEFVKHLSDNIQSAPDAIDGEINFDVSVNSPVSGDMVLCRNTSPIISQYLNYLRINKKAYIRGIENIKKKYIDTILETNAKVIDINCNFHDGLFSKLFNSIISTINKIEIEQGVTYDDAIYNNSVLEMYDIIEGLKVLSEGLTTVDELLDKIRIIFNGDEKDAIQMSTVHKAKGLEADNVFILCPHLLPNEAAKLKWEIKAEQNLMYVAYTRAKKTLNFMKDSGFDFKNTSRYTIKHMKDVLKEAKQKLEENNDIIAPEKIYEHVTIKPLNKLGENNVKSKNMLKKGGSRLINLLQ